MLPTPKIDEKASLAAMRDLESDICDAERLAKIGASLLERITFHPGPDGTRCPEFDDRDAENILYVVNAIEDVTTRLSKRFQAAYAVKAA